MDFDKIFTNKICNSWGRLNSNFEYIVRNMVMVFKNVGYNQASWELSWKMLPDPCELLQNYFFCLNRTRLEVQEGTCLFLKDCLPPLSHFYPCKTAAGHQDLINTIFILAASLIDKNTKSRLHRQMKTFTFVYPFGIDK